MGIGIKEMAQEEIDESIDKVHEVLDGADMNQDIHQLVAYCWSLGVTQGTKGIFPTDHLMSLCGVFLEKHRK